MERNLKNYISRDLTEKLVFISGPRQSGKTTLSKMISNNYEYFNYDVAEDRLPINNKTWRKDCSLLILDELHKMDGWKGWLKGVVDSIKKHPPILVTGSARLDTVRKVGDSLAGRFFSYRLHPFDVKETAGELPAEDSLERLMRVGGFPEPFLKNEEDYYGRWRRSHLDVILRQDLIDLENVRDIRSIETLLEMLRHRVGSPLSVSSLSGDLERDPKTVKKWLDILENMYVIFKAVPYHKNIARSLLKEPKYYFFDAGQVKGDGGAKFENIVACALLKEGHYLEDTKGVQFRLCYLRNKDGREIDFLPVVNDRPVMMVESRLSDAVPSGHFVHFSKSGLRIPMIQVVKDLDREASYESGVEVKKASRWLAGLDLQT